jgi:histidinol-phosphatase (PHP family)
VDHHVHTPRCGHARGTPAEYVASANGVAGVGFNDHLPFLDPARADPVLAMEWEDLPGYVAEVQRLQGPAGTTVLLGVEVDYFPGEEAALQAALAGTPWDYVYGSVHCVGDWGFDDSRRRHRFETADVTALYREYYRLVAQMARSGLFDVWAHPDLPKKFGYFPSESVEEAEGEAVAAVAAADMVMEINTSGWRKPVGEMYPATGLLARAYEAGLPIAFGSDAHRPQEVGYEFERAVALVRRAGYREYITFSCREKIPVPLP